MSYQCKGSVEDVTLKTEVNYIGSYPWLRAGTLLQSHKIIAITDSLVEVVE